MKPYYDEAGITIYHGDCREVLSSVTADLVLTDPPYGVGMDYGEFDDTRAEVKELADEVLPLLRSAAPVVAVTPGIVNLSLWPDADWCLAWTWPHTGSTGRWGFNQWGPILVWGSDPYLKAGLGRRPDLIVCSASDEPSPTGHPCPKPLRAWRRVLMRLSLDGSPVLDPFMGSGTTLRAAKDCGRRAIGIETEERFCEIAATRLGQEVLDLWAG